MISHIVGCFIGVGMLVAAVFCARSDMGLAGGVIYGASLMLLYWASSVYHGLPFAAVGDKKSSGCWTTAPSLFWLPEPAPPACWG